MTMAPYTPQGIGVPHRDRPAASRQSRSKALLAEAIAILHECEQKWGCECPYCDRDFGNDFESHADDCRLKRFLDTANGKDETQDEAD